MYIYILFFIYIHTLICLYIYIFILALDIFSLHLNLLSGAHTAAPPDYIGRHSLLRLRLLRSLQKKHRSGPWVLNLASFLVVIRSFLVPCFGPCDLEDLQIYIVSGCSLILRTILLCCSWRTVQSQNNKMGLDIFSKTYIYIYIYRFYIVMYIYI